MRYVRRWRQRSTGLAEPAHHLTAHRDLGAGRGGAGARRCDQVLTVGCVRRSDGAHDREVRDRTARLAVEHDRAALDGRRRCRVPDARRLLRSDGGQPEQPTCLRRLGRDDDRCSLRCARRRAARAWCPRSRRRGNRAGWHRRAGAAASCAGIAPIPFAGSAAAPFRERAEHHVEHPIRGRERQVELDAAEQRAEEPIDDRLREAAVAECCRCRDVRTSQKIRRRLRRAGSDGASRCEACRAAFRPEPA